MHIVLKSISFIFHPIIIPILGVIFYFSKSPRYIPLALIQAKMVSLSILTILLPILLFFLLKTLGATTSIYLKNLKERSFPLTLNIGILLLIVYRVLPSHEIIELHYFFIGILISNCLCLILVFLTYKASIHLMAITGLFAFYIALSTHFSININGTLALVVLIIGCVATSRLHLKAHSFNELIIGSAIGIIPQVILANFWV